jgi:hypothetical protein
MLLRKLVLVQMLLLMLLLKGMLRHGWLGGIRSRRRVYDIRRAVWQTFHNPSHKYL